MSTTAIRVEGLAKKYLLGEGASSMYRYKTLQESLISAASVPWRLLRRSRPKQSPRKEARDTIWALDDVSFNVERGEVLGIVGPNGAGKSTLLKILSRITEPTRGRIKIRGRVASLLEVGTGFHPELTGRENIFLNGAIMGMRKHEIQSRLDEIVSFAEIERFIDTPVKRYSSGMYVRLAFSVAAHVHPDILVVDEVLAVGDAAFQQRCMGKMHEVSSSEGRTVLFVSHNMGAIESLCSSGICLESGRVSKRGTSAEVVGHYLRQVQPLTVVDDFRACRRSGTGDARVLRLSFVSDSGAPQTEFHMGDPMNILVEVAFSSPISDPVVGINILTDTGVIVADCRSSHYGLRTGAVRGRVEFRMRIERILLYPRQYVVEPWVSDSADLAEFDWVRGAASFVVNCGPDFLSGAILNSSHGISHIPTSWEARALG